MKELLLFDITISTFLTLQNKNNNLFIIQITNLKMLYNPQYLD